MDEFIYFLKYLDWNFVFTFISVCVACLALYLTKEQIKLSNKQHLFDQRIECYMISRDLFELYDSNRKRLIPEIKAKGMLSTIDFEFTWLTNNKYLSEITNVIGNPLKQPEHIHFLSKLEDLEKISLKMELLFRKDKTKCLSKFVELYKDFLFKMSQYQLLYIKMQKYIDDQKDGVYEEDVIRYFKEEHLHNELIDALDKLDKSYYTVKNSNILLKLENEIRLIK